MSALLHMTPFEALSIALAFLSVIAIPLLLALVRGAVKWTRVESTMGAIVARLDTLIATHDAIHAELAAQLREDRRATDERLRWLERRRPAMQPGKPSS